MPIRARADSKVKLSRRVSLYLALIEAKRRHIIPKERGLIKECTRTKTDDEESHKRTP